MSQAFHIVVTCTDRKKVAVPDGLRLRRCRKGTVEKRADAWIQRIRSARAEPVAGTELYSGDHWTVARELPDLARKAGFRPRLWVCSAGYGLVPAETPLKPYAATFAPGQGDSIYRGARDGSPAEAARRWWKQVAKWEGPERGAARQIHSLVKRDSSAHVVVVASATYLAAIAEDIRSANPDPERFLLISAGSAAQNGLSRLLLPADARFQGSLGGSRQALNARIARDALKRFARRPDGFGWLRRSSTQRLAQEVDLITYNRKPLSDEEVKRFIRERLRTDPGARHTRLLRALRESGRACEQKRFRNLFVEVQEEIRAQTT